MANIPALGTLLDNLKDLVLPNAYLIGGAANDNLKRLCEDLDQLKYFIKKYPGWQNNSEFNQELGNRIRDAVFQAEDAIETYIVHAAKQKTRSPALRSIHVIDYLSDLRKLSKEIEEVRAQLQRIQKNYVQNLRFEALQVEDISSSRSKKIQHLFEEETVVGFEDSANELIELLIGESQQQPEELQVISIIGMPGLGKTTLAKKVFNDPKIEYEFYARVFVHVSQEYKRAEVLLGILASVARITEDIHKMSDEQLAQEVQERFRTVKYLIVMDDIWTTDAWNDLKIALPNNKKGSRVLITSQQAAVAHHANKRIGPYYLRPLSPDDSKELLQRKVFGKNSCPPELEMYEEKILNECEGLPLAIIAVAGILLNNRDRVDWWMKVAKDYVAKNEDDSSDIIRLSYNHLPYDLKPCFLYLGAFPQEFEIPVWILVRLWIAEGFIPHTEFMNLEDVAEEYLMELVERSLVMIGQRRSNGLIKTCRINNMLRNFCQREAIKENLFRDIKELDEAIATSSSFKTRRLCLNSHVRDYINSKPSSKHVRSFLSFARDEITLIPEQASSIAKAFTLLRVLDVRPIIFNRFPTELTQLVLLKYIAMSCNFKVLPTKILNLQNLQTIILNTTLRTLEIKGDILKIAQLRHLHTDTSTILQKGKADYSINANLQTLSRISPESCSREVFDKAPKLRKLGICGKLAPFINEIGESALFDSLSKLEFLENLKLLNDDANSKLHSLPREYKFPPKLTSLTLQNTSLDWSHMSTLAMLRSLESLNLKDNAFVGEFWETEDESFRHLKVLKMANLNLVVWKALASNFPTLRSLSIRHCPKLQSIPSGLGEIHSLQVIDLYCTNSTVVSSARKVYMLKLRLQAQQKGPKAMAFKLSVYPPDDDH